MQLNKDSFLWDHYCPLEQPVVKDQLQEVLNIHSYTGLSYTPRRGESYKRSTLWDQIKELLSVAAQTLTQEREGNL